MPLSSESEDSAEGSPAVMKKDKNNSDEDSSDEELMQNKNKDNIIKSTVKPGRKNKGDLKNAKTKSLSSDDSDEEDFKENQQKRSSQPQSAYNYQKNTVEETVSRGWQKGKKKVLPQESESESTDNYESDKGDKMESEDERDVIAPIKKKYQKNSKDITEISKKDSTGLNLNFNALTIDPSEGPISKDHQFVAKKEAKMQESTTSEEEISEDDVANRTRKVFKPTKQKDKQKKVSNVASSDASSSEESNPENSEEEPLAVLVEEVGNNPNYARPNFNARPRSVSPNFQQGQRWIPTPGQGGYYTENPGYSIDNRRSMMQTPYRGGEYYDDDHLSVSSFGGRSRSAMGLAPMPPNRRRISGGNIDYTRESLYMDDGYYDDRGNLFPTPNHYRPNSLLDSLPQYQPSAREQEFIARETGAPLINLPEKQKDPQTGLVGAITAREHQRRVMGPNIMARNAELERERAFERERDRRLVEQRQQIMMVERESTYSRQSFVPPPGPNRYYSQQFLDPTIGQRGSYYDYG
ncbi:17626_t:CDS:1, partial [Acaulospora morrowiae]